MDNNRLSLNGKWKIDYWSNEPYSGEAEPIFFISDTNNVEQDVDCVTECPVPAYFEDMTDIFRTTPLHTKLSWNPMYTLQKYPQAGYCPDMALPNPVGCFVYQRYVELSEKDISALADLYVGGAQNRLSAWINGVYLGTHEGYSCEFFMQIPEGTLKAGENRITLAVSNNRLAGYMGRPVSGLTSRAANECTGGIWGDVEIRTYPDGLRGFNISVSEDLSSFTVKISGAENVEKIVKVFDRDEEICSATIASGKSEITLSTEGYKRWSPASPYLYNIKVETPSQSMERRFGIRRLTSKGIRLYLNGEPYFFRGICEHCYHPITVHPTRDKSYYKRVIRTLKELGFNSIRFHTYVPMPEYMEAADELGMIMEVETPNNTTYNEWREIVNKCSQYTAVCGFSSGNEMVIDEDYIEHLRAVADYVHTNSDALMSPMSAMRGIEYHSWGDLKVEEPFPHNPRRLAALSEFCDMYNTYSLGLTSYDSAAGTREVIDHRNSIYDRPLLTHEICIHGTYIDLSLKDRYKGTRIGETQFMSSVEDHLQNVGLLDKANLYYRNSAKGQQMLRKHCFETVRRCESFAGYDFLGDIDTHWHTFGYCVGMMNEFYELKPGETVENVLKYNSDAVLLCDLPECRSFSSGARVDLPILVSNYGEGLAEATLSVRVNSENKVIFRDTKILTDVANGKISELYTLSLQLPEVQKPQKLVISVSLSGGNTDTHNDWDIYVFPKMQTADECGVAVLNDISLSELSEKMAKGERVVLLGTGPFSSVETRFQLSVAGRTNGHLATVIADHPLLSDLPNEGYCGWQFRKMLDSRAVILNQKRLPHEPIIDIASSYKNARREAMLFEYKIGEGRLIVCTLALHDDDAFASWLKNKIVSYAASDAFEPKDEISLYEFSALCSGSVSIEGSNENMAQNKNDITMN